MKLAVALQSFDGGNLALLDLYGQGEAGKNGRAVDQDGTGSAFPQFAPVFCANQPQVLAQHLKQGVMQNHGNFVALAIDPQGDKLAHTVLLPNIYYSELRVGGASLAPNDFEIIVASIRSCCFAFLIVFSLNREEKPTIQSRATSESPGPLTGAAMALTPVKYSS